MLNTVPIWLTERVGPACLNRTGALGSGRPHLREVQQASSSPGPCYSGPSTPLADVRGSSDMPAEELLAAFVTANVVSSNCLGFGVADGGWALI